MTGIEVAQNALSRIPLYKYLFGAKGEVVSSEEIEALIEAYPSHFNSDSRKAAARAKAGHACIDCSGFVCLNMEFPMKGSWALYEDAPEKRALQHTNGKWMVSGSYIPVGAILWKAGHVGIYVGNQRVAEAVSEETDLQVNNMDGRGFTYCLLYNEGGNSIKYSSNPDDDAVTIPEQFEQSDYIPWIGKIVNAEEVIPRILITSNYPALFFGRLRNGSEVRVIGLYGDYYKVISPTGIKGYINTYYIGNLNAPAYESGYINWTGQVEGANNHVNVRTEPKTSATQHSTFPELPNGSRVRVVGEVLGTEDHKLWYRVKLSDNSIAFIRADLVGPLVITNYNSWNGKASSSTGTVNIRSAATVYSALSTAHSPLLNGDQVTITEEVMGSDGYRWYKVSIEGVSVGYCRSDLIVPVYEGYYKEWFATIQTLTGGGNLRTGPGTAYGLVDGSPYANGTLVHIEGETEGVDGYIWYKLAELTGYHRGYIRADLVQTTANYPSFTVLAKTSTGNLNIRSEAGTNFSIADTVQNGSELTVISQKLGSDLRVWYQVKMEGVVKGYVRSDLVVVKHPTAYSEWTATAASLTGVVNVRSGPSTNSSVISGYPQMNNGDQCTVYGQVDGTDDGRIWYKVKIMDTFFGYVRADLLSHGTVVTQSPGYAKWNGKVRGATQNVNIRADAGPSYLIIATIPNEAHVEVLGVKNGDDNYVWYQVRTANVAGYVRSDLVEHVGDTDGDNPYTIISWAGRVVTEHEVSIYEYPFVADETETRVPMSTYFTVNQKVFDSNNHIWYSVSAEDGVLDHNGIALTGYVLENQVKIFPYHEGCQNNSHNYQMPYTNVLKECVNCGDHVMYEKPIKTVENLTCYSLEDSIDDYFENNVPVTGIGITIETLLSFLQDLETSLGNFAGSRSSAGQNLAVSYRGVFALFAICDLARKNGYDTEMWNTVFLDFDNALLAWINRTFNTSYELHTYVDDYLNWLTDTTLYKQIRLLLLVNTNDSPLVLIDYEENNGVYSSNHYVKLHHLLATIEGYYHPITLPIPKFWFGWGGDLAHECGQIKSYSTNQDIQAMHLIGQTRTSQSMETEYGLDHSFICFEDILSDADAIGISQALTDYDQPVDTHFFSTVLSEYYDSDLPRRSNYFTDFGITSNTPSLDELTLALVEKLNYQLLNRSVLSIWGSGASETVVNLTCKLFAKYLLSEEPNLI